MNNSNAIFYVEENLLRLVDEEISHVSHAFR